MSSAESYSSGSVITPEAVVLDFELAGIGSRAIAFAIDLIVQLMVLFSVLTLVSFVAFASPIVALILLLVTLIMVVLGYPTLMETFNDGRTLGRMVVNTRVVTVEGAPVRFRQAFVRALLGIVDLLATAGGIAVVSALLTRRGQRLGDLVAGTMVLRDPPTTASGSISFYPPAYLASWSQTVDTRALGNDTYQLVRDFATSQDLSDESRAAIAEDLSTLVSARLPHAAKTPQVPAMDYLTAIATATQSQNAPPPPPPGPATPRSVNVRRNPAVPHPTPNSASPSPVASSPMGPSPTEPAFRPPLPQQDSLDVPPVSAAPPRTEPAVEPPAGGGFAAPG